LIDTIKSVEHNYKWIIYRLCFESYQYENEIINTETADQNILDSHVAGTTSIKSEQISKGVHVVDDGVGIEKWIFDEKRLFSNDDCTIVDEGVLQAVMQTYLVCSNDSLPDT
jgi:hypothetical protein